MNIDYIYLLKQRFDFPYLLMNTNIFQNAIQNFIKDSMQTMQYALKEGIPFIVFLVLFMFLLSFRAVEGVDHVYLPPYIQHLELIEVISSVQPSEYFFLFFLKV